MCLLATVEGSVASEAAMLTSVTLELVEVAGERER